MKDRRDWPESFFERRRQTDQQDQRGFYRLAGRSEKTLSFLDDHWWIPQGIFGACLCLGLAVRLAGSISIDGWCLSGNLMHVLTLIFLVTGIVALGSWPFWVAHLALRGHRAEAVGSCALLAPVLVVALLGTYIGTLLPTPGPALADIVSERTGTVYLLEARSVRKETQFRIYARPTDSLGVLWQKRFDESTGLQPSPYRRADADAELLLSGDETLLVIRRDGRYTDAIDLPAGEILTETIDPKDPIGRRLRKRRSARIEAMLADRKK